jgi:hypothetical protein
MSADGDREAVVAVLDRYATACDTRDWPLLEEVFTTDAIGDYGGEFHLEGVAALTALVRGMLGGCGPTQHLLGNYGVAITGDKATATCKVRAFHVGAGELATQTYEVFGSYDDELVRTPGGWRISHRWMRVDIELGTRTILKPPT